MKTHSHTTETPCKSPARSEAPSSKDAIALQQHYFEQLLVSQELWSKQLADAHEASIKAAAEQTATNAAELNKILTGKEVAPLIHSDLKWYKKDTVEQYHSPRHVSNSNHEDFSDQTDSCRSHDCKNEDLPVNKRSLHYYRSSSRSMESGGKHHGGARSRNVEKRGSDRYRDRSRSRDKRSLHHHGRRSRSRDRSAYHRSRSGSRDSSNHRSRRGSRYNSYDRGIRSKDRERRREDKSRSKSRTPEYHSKPCPHSHKCRDDQSHLLDSGYKNPGMYGDVVDDARVGENMGNHSGAEITVVLREVS